MDADNILARRAFGDVFDHASPEVQEGMLRFVRAARLPRAWLVELVAGVAFGPGAAEEALGRLERALPRTSQANGGRSPCSICEGPAGYRHAHFGWHYCAECASKRPELARAGALILIEPLRPLKEKR